MHVSFTVFVITTNIGLLFLHSVIVRDLPLLVLLHIDYLPQHLVLLVRLGLVLMFASITLLLLVLVQIPPRIRPLRLLYDARGRYRGDLVFLGLVGSFVQGGALLELGELLLDRCRVLQQRLQVGVLFGVILHIFAIFLLLLAARRLLLRLFRP